MTAGECGHVNQADDALFVHDLGDSDGNPLLALHGVSGHGRRWEPLVRSGLSEQRVIAPDLRGHGDSTALPPWNLEQHVADILALLDKCGIESLPIMGHSFGGTIAVHLARVAPERVNRLVLLDPALGGDPNAILDAAEGVRSVTTFETAQEAGASKSESWPRVPAQHVADEIEANLELGSDGRWRWKYCPSALVVALSEVARARVAPPAGMPTLLVGASEGGFVDSDFYADYAEALGAFCRIRELNCGHMVYFERTDEVAELVSDFISES